MYVFVDGCVYVFVWYVCSVQYVYMCLYVVMCVTLCLPAFHYVFS